MFQKPGHNRYSCVVIGDEQAQFPCDDLAEQADGFEGWNHVVPKSAKFNPGRVHDLAFV